ncbi:MAG: DUF6505 family protein [Ferrovibrio sp.]|uniref:DUF6505 family protein n=1 Tax=Ferrovibrio sp. TaxID=1917215 RepID=UPI00391D1D55
MKLLRCIRFDDSDTRVFPRAAAPGEWAVPGTFVFADADPEALGRQDRQAFANGFLGLGSFGRSTLVTVATITPEEYEATVTALAEHLVDHYGAPDQASAEAAAREEVDYAAALCEHPINTLLSLSRFIEGEAIREQFRVVPPPGEKLHTKIWEITPDG